jgi:hypothetical protein
MNLAPPKAAAKHELLLNEPASGTQTCYANLTCGMSNPIFDDLKSLLQNFGLVQTGGNFGLCNGESYKRQYRSYLFISNPFTERA